MKNILILIIFPGVLLSQGVVDRTFTLINQGDTSYFIKTYTTYDDGSYNDDVKFIGKDMATINQQIEQLVTDSENIYTEIAGAEGKLLELNDKSKSLDRDLNGLAQAIVGKNLTQIKNTREQANFAGEWKIINADLGINDMFTFTFNENNGNAKMELKSDPNTKYTVKINSPSSFTLVGLGGVDMFFGNRGKLSDDGSGKVKTLWTGQSTKQRAIQIVTQ